MSIAPIAIWRVFFSAIRYADFSQTFVTGGLGSSFDELKTSFNEVLDAFRQARAEKEEQARYLQTVVQHIGVGLVVFDGTGNVSLINTAAKRLLHVPRLGNIGDLDRVSPALANTMRGLGPRDRHLVRFEEGGEMAQLSLHASVFRMRDNEHTLVSLFDIGSDLDDKEMEAWQNLIRVLTHEIMNSITPIASLASTAADMLGDDDLDTETTDDIRTAVSTIQRRSEGLLHFVEAYRNLTRLPAPSFKITSVTDLFARVEQLLQPQFTASVVELHTRVEPPTLELTADPEQVEQVLINLLRNAREAAAGRADARVELTAYLSRGKVVVEVFDNGPGIVEEALDQVFIPFFTTKQEGSGIGLSLCRQIMRLNSGSIAVRSEPEVRTVFALRF
jgi:nitrogen fixation/metabolism regulation signal transduction histidine kinase